MDLATTNARSPSRKKNNSSVCLDPSTAKYVLSRVTDKKGFICPWGGGGRQQKKANQEVLFRSHIFQYFFATFEARNLYSKMEVISGICRFLKEKPY